MLDAIAASKPYFEIASFIANIILSIGIILSFSQIKLLKRDIKIRNERASKEKAIDAASRYLTNYVKADNELNTKKQELNFSSYSGLIGDFSKKSIIIDKNFLDMLRSAPFLPALNELEAIAAHYMTGVADEQVGFEIIGKSYCSTVEFKYNVIAFLHDSSDGQKYFSNTVNLYKTWRPRLSRLEIEFSKNTLEQDLASIPATAPIKPIGA